MLASVAQELHRYAVLRLLATTAPAVGVLAPQQLLVTWLMTTL